jgi:ADP-heptose:LPS heptosyltransferase
MIPWRRTDAPKPPADPQEARSILVVKLSGWRDFVEALAAAKAVRDFHVGARITLLTTEPYRELAEHSPYFDLVDAGGKPKDAQATTQLAARIRAEKYDIIYDFENSRRTNNYFQGLRPWPPKWSGSAPGCAYPISAATREARHPLDRLEGQLRDAGLVPAEPLIPDLRWVRAALRDPPRLQPEFFGIRTSFVVLTPRAADTDPHRRWPEEQYIELARRISAHGAVPVVLGGPEERAIGAAMAAKEKKVKNLVARTDLFQSVALCQRAAHVVGDDVDSMHLAAAAGGSCIVLLSSMTDPPRPAPRGHGGVVAVTATVLADLPVDQVDRQLRNSGVYLQAGAA